jgi:hypothetical protein
VRLSCLFTWSRNRIFYSDSLQLRYKTGEAREDDIAAIQLDPSTHPQSEQLVFPHRPIQLYLIALPDIELALQKIDEVASNQEGIAAEEALILRGCVSRPPSHFLAHMPSVRKLGSWKTTKTFWNA